MNPACFTPLIREDGTNIGERAHIIANAADGPPTFANLLLLCPTCHRTLDASPTDKTPSLLHSWKAERKAQLEALLQKRYSSFDALRAAAVPLLTRNHTIFTSYGPDHSDPTNSSRHDLWQAFEPELVANNRRLELLFTGNEHLFHPENWDVITRFLDHAKEFIATRDPSPLPRRLLFPDVILDMFGLSNTANRLPPNLSALQNMIANMVATKSFVALELYPRQILTYSPEFEDIELDLTNRPHMQQLYWDGNYFRPKTTSLRLETLVFFVSWFEQRGIRYDFEKQWELTEITLNERHHVKLFYTYTLTKDDIRDTLVKDDMIVVNTHNWNNAPITDQARAYAVASGFTAMTQDEFLSFAARHI